MRFLAELVIATAAVSVAVLTVVDWLREMFGARDDGPFEARTGLGSDRAEERRTAPRRSTPYIGHDGRRLL